MKKRLWVWITVIVLGTGVLGTLAGFWNYNLVKTSDLSKTLGRIPINPVYIQEPWVGITLGSLGFVIVCVFLYLIFFKLIKEIRINQAQNEFLARVSHELKTPISTLELTASMLKDKTSNTLENVELWKLFQGELDRLKTEVDSLLAAAVASEKSIKPIFEQVQLTDWIQSQFPSWKTILGQKANIDLKLPNRNAGVPAFLDSRLLSMVCQNLLTNSKKFAIKEPQVKIELSIDNHLKNKQWVLVFSDKGWGFKPKDKRKIFRRFYRAKTQSHQAVPGTGLGLYLVRMACRAMNLKIEGFSEGVGLGSRFEIRGDM